MSKRSGVSGGDIKRCTSTSSHGGGGGGGNCQAFPPPTRRHEPLLERRQRDLPLATPRRGLIAAGHQLFPCLLKRRLVGHFTSQGLEHFSELLLVDVTVAVLVKSHEYLLSRALEQTRV